MNGDTAAVIVAAGDSTRLGRPKQLERIGGENLLERSARIAQEAGCSPVILVLGASAELIQAEVSLDVCTIVINPEWRDGMASSIAAGVRGLPAVCGALLLTCDMPAVTADHLQTLVATGDLAASRYGNRNGVPAFFPASMFPELMALRGDAGARELLRAALAIDLPHGDLDIDTPADLDRARRLFA